MISIQFKLNVQSEAIRTLNRITKIDRQRDLYLNMVGDMKYYVLVNYISAWGGARGRKIGARIGAISTTHRPRMMSEDYMMAMPSLPDITEPKTVWQAVKAAMFEPAKKGLLTGSTLKSIKSRVSNRSASVGIFGGKWPSTTGHKRISMVAMLDYLEEVWGSSIKDVKYWGHSTAYAKKISRVKRIQDMSRAFAGDVEVFWNGSGFYVKWPESASSLGLKDLHVPSEPYATKEYGTKGRSKKSREFFYIDNTLAKELMDIAGNYIDVKILNRSRK